ncbi:hypothetical protein [Amycolatopsis magusensis]|uniref:hypothetical protein n=1 Tax=Amycolatopsis magusensis TaxID=882444 RepID=UPI0024A9E9D6|nr:hypothetical protein [Amycolatopsis magusensis]MDI5979603.1 hypothetical protein [Amycolatopsis magusensis]
MSTFAVLAFLDAVRGHLRAHVLPAPVGVQVTTWTKPVTVMLDEQGVTRLAGALVKWANTLTEVSASVWRTPGGDSVHLDVSGRVPSGVPVRVYGGVAYDASVFPDLPADTHQDVEVAQLRAWEVAA